MRIVSIVGVLAFVASAAAAQIADPATPPAGFELTPELRTSGEAMVDEAGQALLDSLNDPASARYRSVHLRTTIGTDRLPHVSVCGQVNSKNAMGGYAGWTAFAYPNSSVGLIVGRGSIIDAASICQLSRGHWDTTDYADRLAEKAKLD